MEEKTSKITINEENFHLEIFELDDTTKQFLDLWYTTINNTPKQEKLEKPVEPKKHIFQKNDSRIRDAQGRKQCAKCKEWLPESEFYPGTNTKDGLRSECKECWGEYKKNVIDKRNEERLTELNDKGLTIKTDKNETAPVKICSHCNMEKPPSDFSKRKASKDGLQNWCKKCTNKYFGKKQYTEQEHKKIEQNPIISEQTSIKDENKPTPIGLPGEKKVFEKSPDNTSLFLNWLQGKREFDIRDFCNAHPEITLEHAKIIIAHQIRKHKITQLSSVDFKVT